MLKRYGLMLTLSAALALGGTSTMVEAGVSAHAVSVHSTSHAVIAYAAHDVVAAHAIPLSHDVVAKAILKSSDAPTRIETAQVPERQPLVTAIHPLTIARYDLCENRQLYRPPVSCRR